MDDVKLSDIIQDLNQKVDAVYRHGTLQERYSAIARDYGEGFVLIPISCRRYPKSV